MTDSKSVFEILGHLSYSEGDLVEWLNNQPSFIWQIGLPLWRRPLGSYVIHAGYAAEVIRSSGASLMEALEGLVREVDRCR